MKKVFLVCAMITMYLGSFAQNDSVGNKQGMDHNKSNDMQQNNGIHNEGINNNNNINSDCAVKMESGKVLMTIDGKTAVLDKEMTLKNGTVVMKDGKLKMKEGKVVQLNEGDCIDNSGNMVVVKNSQIKKTPATSTKGSKP